MNKGFNLKLEKQHQDGTEWKFGAASPVCIALIPENERILYLPQGEKQNLGEEKMDCVTRAYINDLATKFNWLYKNGKLTLKEVQFLVNNGYVENEKIDFSDRFIAKLSGTTREGNSLKAPIDTIRKVGLIPKKLYPQVESFDEYYQEVPDNLKQLGMKFLELFSINYDQESDLNNLIDMYVVAGFAWPQFLNGEYPRVDDPFNHAFLEFANPNYTIFDNYEEAPNDWIKKLASDYRLFEYKYRVFISRTAEKKSILKRILVGFKNWWNEIIG